MSDIIHYKNEDCICDVCIDHYVELYLKIERLQELRLRWLSGMSKKERDHLNVLLKPKETVAEKMGYTKPPQVGLIDKPGKKK